MGQSILLGLQVPPLQGILQPSGLQIFQQLFLALPLPLQLLHLDERLPQGAIRLLPGPMGLPHRLQQGQKLLPGETIEPLPLLPGARQILGLPLHREIQQEGAQGKDLGTADGNALEPAPTADPTLLQAPFPADEKLALPHLQLLGLQPALHGRGEGEGGLHPSPLTTTPQEARPLSSLGTAQQRIEGIQKDRLASAGLPGQHREALAETQFQGIDEGDVLKAQRCEHARWIEDIGGTVAKGLRIQKRGWEELGIATQGMAVIPTVCQCKKHDFCNHQ